MPKQKNSSYYLKKTFNEHHDKKLREQNTESNTNLDCEDRVITDILTEIAIRIRECIQSDEKSSKTTKFLKIIVSSTQYLIASKMARTGAGLARPINNFENRRFAAAKDVANACRRNNRFKIKFLLLQGKNIDVKVPRNVVR